MADVFCTGGLLFFAIHLLHLFGVVIYSNDLYVAPRTAPITWVLRIPSSWFLLPGKLEELLRGFHRKCYVQKGGNCDVFFWLV